MSSVLVIYHANCSDGFCAAWLFRHAFPDAEFHAAHYGTEPPDVTGKTVYLIDFSYKREAMRQILSRAHAVTVLDHHKTAEAELAGITDEFIQRPDLIANPPGSELPRIVFDLSKSGGRLTWEYLYGNQLLPDDWLSTSRSGYSLGVAPWLVDYTEDRDLWRWALPESREINACLRTYPLDFSEWDFLNEHGRRIVGRRELVSEGRAILRQESQIVADHVRHAREIDLAGHKILAVNATILFSEIAGELAKDRPFGACYFDRFDGKRQWSLRSTADGIDVSEVAKTKGGGGHKQAAGFEEILA